MTTRRAEALNVGQHSAQVGTSPRAPRSSEEKRFRLEACVGVSRRSAASCSIERCELIRRESRRCGLAHGSKSRWGETLSYRVADQGQSAVVEQEGGFACGCPCDVDSVRKDHCKNDQRQPRNPLVSSPTWPHFGYTTKYFCCPCAFFHSPPSAAHGFGAPGAIFNQSKEHAIHVRSAPCAFAPPGTKTHADRSARHGKRGHQWTS